jgi:hypothetical protein
MTKTYKLLRFNVENLNHRIYTREEVCPHLEYLNERAKSNQLYGQIGYPENFELSLTKASHKIEKIYVDGDYLMADIEILDTKEGNLLKDMMKEFGEDSIVFRTRSAGVINEQKIVVLKEIITVDAVNTDTDAFKDLMD